MVTSYIGLEINSCCTYIYKFGSGIVLKEPSLIAMSSNVKDKEIKAVGLDAKKFSLKNNKDILIFSPVENDSIKYEELASKMLKSFLKKILTEKDTSRKIEAFVSVPVGYTKKEKILIENVCYKAGITDVIILPGAVLYAIGNNIDISSPTEKLFVKISSNTTSISIVASNSIVNGYTLSLGSSKINNDIISYIEKKYLTKISFEQSELIKLEICSLYENYDAKLNILGINVQTKLKMKISICADELYSIVSDFYTKVIDAIKSIIHSLDPKTINEFNNNGIYFYGGGSKIVGLEHFITNTIGFKPIFKDTPMPEVFGVDYLLKDSDLLKKILKAN